MSLLVIRMSSVAYSSQLLAGPSTVTVAQKHTYGRPKIIDMFIIRNILRPLDFNSQDLPKTYE